MKTKAIAPGLALAILAGCASSGGGSGGGSSAQSAPPPVLCVFVPFLCILAAFDDSIAGPGSSTSPAPLSSAGFTTWGELQRDARTEAPGLGYSVAYEMTDGIMRVVRTPVAAGGAIVQYDASGKLISFGDGTASFGTSHSGNLAALGQAGIDRLHGASGSTALVANPYALGWNYQSFGAWNQQNAGGVGAMTVSSFGQATPASAVPTSGQATFTGKSAGFYVSPAGQGSVAAADVTVNANFSARALGFSTSGTTIARDLKAPVAAPHLNLNGTFTYSAGSNAFAGTVTSASGSMSGPSKGQFYGPAAQELGGAYSLKSPTTTESFTGAYGAKR